MMRTGILSEINSIIGPQLHNCMQEARCQLATTNVIPSYQESNLGERYSSMVVVVAGTTQVKPR